MAQMKLNLSAKQLDQEVNYIPYSQINLDYTNNQSFLICNIEEEVKKLPKKRKKLLYAVAKSLLISSISSLIIVNPVFAATTSVAIMPPDIMKIGMYLIGICATASTVLAIILAQLAGGYRMLMKSKEATEWTTSILKGYTQVILAPVLILAIAFLAYLLFGNSAFFVKPF